MKPPLVPPNLVHSNLHLYTMAPCEATTTTSVLQPEDVKSLPLPSEKEEANSDAKYTHTLPHPGHGYRDHFSSLLLSGSYALTMLEVAMFACLFLVFTVPSTSGPIMDYFDFKASASSLPRQHLPYVLLGLSLFRRVYNSYLEVSSFVPLWLWWVPWVAFASHFGV